MQASNAEKFQNNQNIRNLVDPIEQKHMEKSSGYDPKKAAPNFYKDKAEGDRSRKFKRPMDSLKQRQDRIEMVKGMTVLENGIADKKTKEQALKSIF